MGLVDKPTQSHSEEGEPGWPVGTEGRGSAHRYIWEPKRARETERLARAYNLLCHFVPLLRINNYLLVEDDQISPRKKHIRSILIRLL